MRHSTFFSLSLAGASLAAVVALTAACVTRPESWTEATHGRTTPNYTQVFDKTQVQVFEIEIDPTTLSGMRADLASILASSSGPGAMPMGDGGMMPPFGDGGMMPPLVADGGMMQPPFGDGGMMFPPMGDGGAQGAMPGAGGGDLLSRDPAYVPVTVRYNGRTWPYVAMRFKGNSSLASLGNAGNRKLPFRLHFDHYENDHPEITNQRFYGFQELTFSANFADDSQVREAFVLDALTDMGVPAPRYSFARITIRTGSALEYWGLYTLIEDPSDNAMQDRVLGRHDGNVYKPEGTTATWSGFSAADFEKKSNETEADFSDVQGAIAALGDGTTDRAAWRAALEAKLDVNGFLRWLAVNTVAGNWDAYGQMAHNYYLYGDLSANGRLRWIPWDHNLSLGTSFGMGAQSSATPAQTFLHTAVTSQWPLIRTLLDDPTYMAAYRSHVQAALDGPFASAAASARLDALHALVAPHVVGDQGEQDGSRTIASPAAFEQSIRGTNGLVPWIDQRVTAARSALAQ